MSSQLPEDSVDKQGEAGESVAVAPALTLGETVSVLRKRRQLSQVGLAALVGLSLNTIARLERGKTDPRVSVLVRVSRALEIPIEHFLPSSVASLPLSLRDTGRASPGRSRTDESAGDSNPPTERAVVRPARATGDAVPVGLTLGDLLSREETRYETTSLPIDKLARDLVAAGKRPLVENVSNPRKIRKFHKPFARLLRVSTTRIDGGSLFGSTAKERWERFAPTDRQNRVAVGNYCLLIDHPSGWVLVNAGPGDKPPLSLDVAPMRSRSSLLRELRELGLLARDISVVIYTHLHNEYVGGGTHITSSGRTLPTFPNARYIVQRASLDEASRPNERSARGYRADDFEPLVERGQLEAIEGGMEVVKGVWIEPVPGPTAGHQIVIASSGNSTYAFTGILFPTSMHLAPQVISAADWNPEATARMKAAVLEAAVAESWVIAPVGSDEWVPASELGALAAFSLGAAFPLGHAVNIFGDRAEVSGSTLLATGRS